MTTIALDDSGQAKIDLSYLVESRLLVQANSGGGKSWTLRRLLEQSFGKVQHLIVDPEGEFVTLRHRYDYVVAGTGRDVPAEPRSAKLLVRKLLEEQLSAVLDIYELKAHDRVRFVRYFLEALVDAPKALWHPVLVVVDEAHVYCPQKGDAESANAVIDLATRGRKRGYCSVLATQRLSKLHKDAAAECNNKLIGRSALDVDMKRASEELGFTTREDQQRLRQLRPGQFFAFGPAISDTVRLVEIGGVKTEHPKVGSRYLDAELPRPTGKVLKALSKLVGLPAEAEQEARDLAGTRSQLREARQEINRMRRSAGGISEADVKRQVTEATKPLQEKVKRLEDGRRGLLLQVSRAVSTVEKLGATLRQVLEPGAETEMAVEPSARSKPEIPPTRVAPELPSPDGVSAPQLRILEALASLEPLSVTPMARPALAALSGVSPSSGGYFNNLGRLRSLGLIDYPQGGRVSLTNQGREMVPGVRALQTAEELQEAWCRVVAGPQAEILRRLISIYPEDVCRSELAEMVGVSRTSGGYFNNLGRLRTLGAIEYPQKGRVRASPLLWPE